MCLKERQSRCQSRTLDILGSGHHLHVTITAQMYHGTASDKGLTETKERGDNWWMDMGKMAGRFTLADGAVPGLFGCLQAIESTLSFFLLWKLIPAPSQNL